MTSRSSAMGAKRREFGPDRKRRQAPPPYEGKRPGVLIIVSLSAPMGRRGRARRDRVQYERDYSASNPGLQHRQHLGDQRMADNVGIAQPHHRDLGHRFKPAGDV